MAKKRPDPTYVFPTRPVGALDFCLSVTTFASEYKTVQTSGYVALCTSITLSTDVLLSFTPLLRIFLDGVHIPGFLTRLASGLIISGLDITFALNTPIPMYFLIDQNVTIRAFVSDIATPNTPVALVSSRLNFFGTWVEDSGRDLRLEVTNRP